MPSFVANGSAVQGCANRPTGVPTGVAVAPLVAGEGERPVAATIGFGTGGERRKEGRVL